MTLTALKAAPAAFTPRRLILELLDADPALMGHSRALLAAGDVFSFSPNQMRVALSRLVGDGLLSNPQRGSYALSGGGAAMREEIQRWRHLEDQLCPWQGDWCVLITENLATESSTRFRAQTRALRLRGMQRWRPGLWVRPSNLSGGLARLVEDVAALGMDSIAGSFVIEQTDLQCAEELRKLWDAEALRRSYARSIANMKEALERLKGPNRMPVLVETLELGGEMIRRLLTDPLLPECMLGCDSRQQLITLVKQYDAAGLDRWREFMDQLNKAG